MACRAPGTAALARAAIRRRPIILSYHGLTTNPNIDDWTQAEVECFEAQMRYLRDHYSPVSLDRLVRMLHSGQIEPHTVAVTFDDGYKSNYDLAYPILKGMGISATIFVTSGFISGKGMTSSYLWPDFVKALVLSHPEPSFDLRHLDLGQWQLPSLRTRYEARNSICERLKSLPDRDRRRLVQGLARDYGGSIDHDRFRDYRPMTPTEVRSLAADDLITIGAHTRTHPILSRLDSTDLEGEIVGCKEDLEKMTERPVTQFAYPNGRRQDISTRAPVLVEKHYACAVTTEAGINPPGQNKCLLRRVTVGCNLPLAQFAKLVSGCYFVLQKAVREL